MKAASPQHWLLLTGSNVHRTADLVKVVLSDSGTLLMTTFDQDVVVLDENRLRYSEDFSNAAWVKSNCSLTATQGPPGTTGSAFIMRESSDAAPAVHALDDNQSYLYITASAGMTGCLSVFLSASSPPYDAMMVRVLSGGALNYTPYIIADTSGNITGRVSVLNSGSQSVGNGWWRYWFTFGCTNTGYLRPTLRTISGSNTYTGDGTKSMAVFGIQLTQTSSLGNYVGTTSVTSSDRKVYSASSGALGKVGSRTAQGLEVDSLDLTVWASGVLLSGSVPVHLAAAQGKFDGAPVTVRRVLMSASGDATSGYQTVFDGVVGEVEAGATELRLTARSRVSLLSQPFPPRNFQPACPYQVYDADCGVNSASFVTPRNTATGSNSVSTTSVVYMENMSAPADYFKQGWVIFKTGALTGLRRTVVSSSNWASDYQVHRLEVVPPLPSAPAAGTSFDTYRGCDKTRTKCSGTFSNLTRFGGFADMPPPKRM